MSKALLILCALPCALLLAGLLYQWLGLMLDRFRFPPRGRLLASAGTKLHVWEQGSHVPMVVLEAGIAGTCLGWAIVQPKIAEWTGVLSYDRAGLGWSGRAKKPRTVAQMNDELAELLHQCGHPGPFVLVGHSFGGLLVRAFAARYPDRVAALVLVDPVSVASWTARSDRDQRRLRRGIQLSRRGALLARFGVVRLCLTLLMSGSRFLPKLIGRTAAGNGTPTMERLVGQVRRLPSELWPIIRSQWSDAKCFDAMAAYLQALPNCAEEACALRPPAHIPQIILSAATATADELVERDAWATHSDRGKHIRVPGTGHWIQLEQPEIVLHAIREAVDLAANRPLEIN